MKNDITFEANQLIHNVQEIATNLARQYHDPNIATRVVYEVTSERFGGEALPINMILDFTIYNGDDYLVPVRYYRNNPCKRDKIIIYIHGGGWIAGSLKTHDALCRHICAHVQYPVISIDYRLAPEHKFPAALTDITAVYQWVIKNKDKLDISDNASIIIAGDSAGANLVLSLNLALMDKSWHLPEKNILIYPPLNLYIPKVVDNPYAHGYLLTVDYKRYYVKNYLANPDSAKVNYNISPFVAPDAHLKQLPRTLLLSAECDMLTAEAHLFLQKLNSLGHNNI